MTNKLVIKMATTTLTTIKKNIARLFAGCLLFSISFSASAQAPCDPEDPTAGNGTSFCAPAPVCSSGNFLWTQAIDQNNGDPSEFTLFVGGVTSYLIPVNTYPAALTTGYQVNINMSDIVSYDGYITRELTSTQNNERWRLVFKKNGITVHETPYTNDLIDGVKQTYWRGSLGTAVLPNGADEVYIEHWDIANPGDGTNSVKPVSICMSITSVYSSVTGNIFNDRDGLTDNNINQTAGLPNAKTNVGNSLHANLLNAGGLVVASVPVSSNGTYLFDNVPPGIYSVQLTVHASTGTYASPQPEPATELPAGWANTGEFIGNTAGNDGLVNSKSAYFSLAVAEAKSEVNFGIERLPNSKDYTSNIPAPQLNDEIVLNSPNLPILTGSDPEDQPIEDILTGRSVKITELPINSTLKYNGIPVIVNQLIPVFNPSLLTVLFDIITTLSSTEFKYAYVDSAGLPDPTPATYKLIWTGGPLIINVSEFNVSKNNCTANLFWKTLQEVNGEKFEIEVSIGNDRSFAKAGTVIASGNSSTPKSYQFSYQMQAGVNHYFRLKLVDFDGSFKYSDTRVATSCSKGKTGIVIAPNPVLDKFRITGMENGKNSIAVYGTNGQLVRNQVIIQNQGDVNIHDLAPGIYTIKITSEKGNSVVSKIIKY